MAHQPQGAGAGDLGVRLSRETSGTGTPEIVVRWSPEGVADGFNLYLGALAGLDGTDYGQCARSSLTTTWATLPETGAPGTGLFVLVTTEHPGGEGSLGTDGDGLERPNINPCP